MDAHFGLPYPADSEPLVSYVVLSGGSSRRLGRDKATTHVGGQRLLDRLLAQLPPDLPIVLVGPAVADLPREVSVVREDPAGSGPLAAIAAAAVLGAGPLLGVIAADMPFAAPLVARLLEILGGPAGDGFDAVVPVDPDGHLQPLAAAYRRVPLIEALSQLGQVAGLPVRAVLPGLRVMELPVPAGDLADVDTAGGLRAARVRANEEGRPVDEWLANVIDALGLDVPVDIDAILDVARDAAHNVERPAAPLTTYLLGAAVARGAEPAAAAEIISSLAAQWPHRAK